MRIVFTFAKLRAGEVYPKPRRNIRPVVVTFRKGRVAVNLDAVAFAVLIARHLAGLFAPFSFGTSLVRDADGTELRRAEFRVSRREERRKSVNDGVTGLRLMQRGGYSLIVFFVNHLAPGCFNARFLVQGTHTAFAPGVMRHESPGYNVR